MRFAIPLFLLTACVAFAGVAFGVNPIGPLHETYIGYQINSALPFASVSFYNGSYSYKERDEDYPEYSDTTISRAGILVPTVGSKFFLGSSPELKPFIRLSVGMPFFLYLTSYDDDYDAQEDLDEFREDLGLTLIYGGGAGVEYFLSESFSIGGEFNYRALSTGIKDTYTGGVTRIRLNIGGTSTGLWFSFYF